MSEAAAPSSCDTTQRDALPTADVYVAAEQGTSAVFGIACEPLSGTQAHTITEKQPASQHSPANGPAECMHTDPSVHSSSAADQPVRATHDLTNASRENEDPSPRAVAPEHECFRVSQVVGRVLASGDLTGIDAIGSDSPQNATDRNQSKLQELSSPDALVGEPGIQRSLSASPSREANPRPEEAPVVNPRTDFVDAVPPLQNSATNVIGPSHSPSMLASEQISENLPTVGKQLAEDPPPSSAHPHPATESAPPNQNPTAEPIQLRGEEAPIDAQSSLEKQSYSDTLSSAGAVAGTTSIQSLNIPANAVSVPANPVHGEPTARPPLLEASTPDHILGEDANRADSKPFPSMEPSDHSTTDLTSSVMKELPSIQRYDSVQRKDEMRPEDRKVDASNPKHDQAHEGASIDPSESDGSYPAPKRKRLPKVAKERPHSCRIFVGNLATEFITVPELTSIFERYGPLIEEPVLRRSFGFVQYGKPEHALAAVASEQGRLIGGIALDLKIADNRDVRKGAHIVNNTPYSHGSREQILAAAAAAGISPPPEVVASAGTRGLLGAGDPSLNRKRRRDKSPPRRSYASQNEHGLPRGFPGTDIRRSGVHAPSHGRMRPASRSGIHIRILCMAPQARLFAHHCEGLFRDMTGLNVDVIHIIASSLGESLGRAMQDLVPYVVVVASKDVEGATCTIRTLEDTGYEKAGRGSGVIPIREAINICLIDQGLSAAPITAGQSTGYGMGPNMSNGNTNMGIGIGGINGRGGPKAVGGGMQYGGMDMQADGLNLGMGSGHLGNIGMAGGNVGAMNPVNAQLQSGMGGMRAGQAGGMGPGMKQPMYPSMGGGPSSGQLPNGGRGMAVPMSNMSNSVGRSGMYVQIENTMGSSMGSGMVSQMPGANMGLMSGSGFSGGFGMNAGNTMAPSSHDFAGNGRTGNVREPGWMRGTPRNISQRDLGGRSANGGDGFRSERGSNISSNPSGASGFTGYNPGGLSGSMMDKGYEPQNPMGSRPSTGDVSNSAGYSARNAYETQTAMGSSQGVGNLVNNSQVPYGGVGGSGAQGFQNESYPSGYGTMNNSSRQGQLFLEDRVPNHQYGYGGDTGSQMQSQEPVGPASYGQQASRGQLARGGMSGERAQAQGQSGQFRNSSAPSNMGWTHQDGSISRMNLHGGPSSDGNGVPLQDPRRVVLDRPSGDRGYTSGLMSGAHNAAAGSIPPAGSQASTVPGSGNVDMGKLSNLISAFQQQAQQGQGTSTFLDRSQQLHGTAQHQPDHSNLYGQSFMGAHYQQGPSQQQGSTDPHGSVVAGVVHSNPSSDGQGGIQSLLANPALQQALQNINQGMGSSMHQREQQQGQQPHQQPYNMPGNSPHQPQNFRGRY